jgi:CheY-like chemotaxis protein
MPKNRILIVEDEALTVLALKRDLAELGYEVTGDASTAVDALRAAEDHHADLVLMDIELEGGVSGVAAAAAIRGQLDIPIVFLTAHAAAETLARAIGRVRVFAEALHRPGVESGDRHRDAQAPNRKRDAPSASFTNVGECGTILADLSSPTMAQDRHARASRKFVVA